MASQEGPLYHLAPLAAWGAAKHANTPYTPATYEQDGFTHLTLDPDALIPIANHFYKGIPGDFVLLTVDRTKCGAELRFEPAAPVGDAPPPDTTALFPHLYGPIPPAAVTEETAVDRTPSGKFLGILWGIEVIHSRADWIKLSAS